MVALPEFNPRFWALSEISQRKPQLFERPKEPNGQYLEVSDIYGSNVFSWKDMQKKLSTQTNKRLKTIIRQGARLDRTLADEVAQAVKEWAIEKGATHFCHWFQPQTGLTAEKHDAFLSFDESGQPIEQFSGSQLIQSEPDASSFPSGGQRSTFEARGYTVWDPSSPIFLMEGANRRILCIPSVFISYHGEALDYKSPLLRSMETLSQSAVAMLHLFGKTEVTRVIPTLGTEQEYFLIDRAFYLLRPDLVAAGRTLIGSKPPKGQELEDHYFGAIQSRIQAFMQEVEYELYKLGVPVKTRHNEVAPAQYETAPIFEGANVASDHNQLVMELLRNIAQRHNLALLLHEKPFAGINGSGKHGNWSMMDSAGNNLLEPGKHLSQNLLFLIFLVATLKAVYYHSGILRAAIASSGNDHRLGANEAPPAIISVFLGKQLTDILDKIENGTEIKQDEEIQTIALGISQLPDVFQDYTDRNRTSPFAFTGNKFEFRAIGSSSSVSTSMTFLNVAVADALDSLRLAIQESVENGVEFDKAVMKVIRDTAIETRPIRFEGNNYSEEWVLEAASRALPDLHTTPEALAELVKPGAMGLLWRTNVFTFEEMEAHYYVRLERYIKDIEIEVETLKELVQNYVLPAAYQQQLLQASSVEKLRQLTLVNSIIAPQMQKLQVLADYISKLHYQLATFIKLANQISAESNLESKAHRLANEILPAMAEIRQSCDSLEELISDEIWPLPKYREMLFLY